MKTKTYQVWSDDTYEGTSGVLHKITPFNAMMCKMLGTYFAGTAAGFSKRSYFSYFMKSKCRKGFARILLKLGTGRFCVLHAFFSGNWKWKLWECTLSMGTIIIIVGHPSVLRDYGHTWCVHECWPGMCRYPFLPLGMHVLPFYFTKGMDWPTLLGHMHTAA